MLARLTRSCRYALGITEGAIVPEVDSLIHAPMLRLERLGLVGRCDQVLWVGDAYVRDEQ